MSQPAELVFRAAFHDFEVTLLQLASYGTGLAFAHYDAVNGADGRNFRRRSSKEDFIGDVKDLARQHLLDHRNSAFFGELDDGSAGDPRQHGRPERRRIDLSVAHHKNIFSAAFADVARVVQRSAFHVAIGDGFHLDELRVHVIGGSLGHGGQRIGRDAVPGADADIHALLQRLIAQVLAPLPGQQVNLYRVLQRTHAQAVVAAENQRADVARADAVDADQVDHGLSKLLARKAGLRAINFGRIQQAADVRVQVEDGRALRRLIGADALKQAGAVADHVGGYMDSGLAPGDELAVVPDFFIEVQCHK